MEALEQAARTAVVGSPTYLTDASSDSWQEELAAYSPGSRLSDWSHLDAEELEEELAGEQAGLAALPGKADAGGDTGGPAAAAAAAAGALLPQERAPGSPGSPPSAAAEARAPAPGAGGRRLAPPPSPARRESPYTRHSLSVWIASKQSGGQPARLLEPRLCFHEKELAQQVGGRVFSLVSFGKSGQVVVDGWVGLGPPDRLSSPRRRWFTCSRA